jgi:hypothetical protein
MLGEFMLRVLVSLLFSVGIMTATSFTTSASCIVGGAGYPRNILDNGLTDCRAELDLPGINPIYSTATVSTSFEELNNGVQFSAHTAVTNVYNDPALYPNSQSTAVANVQFTLATAGPARSGYVLISGGNSCHNSLQFAEVVVPGVASFECFAPNGPAISAAGQLYPITLGTQLRISAFAASSTNGNNSNIQADLSNVSLLFFESDAATPVAASVIPEPSTILLCTSALGLLTFAFRKRSRPDKSNTSR